MRRKLRPKALLQKESQLVPGLQNLNMERERLNYVLGKERAVSDENPILLVVTAQLIGQCKRWLMPQKEVIYIFHC